ncbi:hypothetical protein NIES4071_39580 [Calothrix sp. NIES-4071]|nr:hypothetical protein NIES4071_39580 [Calothrix sp. NIES-4071]BAZ58276.1 hypothetical protein NIES4105_39520 [Calothrix sp. NIES-4105]
MGTLLFVTYCICTTDEEIDAELRKRIYLPKE